MENISTSIATNHLAHRGSETLNFPNHVGDNKTSIGTTAGAASNFIGNENQHSDTESLVSESDLLFGFLHPHPTSAKNNISNAAQD